MSLFQPSVLKAYLKSQDKEAVSRAYEKYVKHFHNTEIQQNIRESKEEQYQEGFLTELLGNIFGFTLNPKPNFNLTTEYKNEKGAKKADGAILREGKALAVIELKSTKTKDLEKIRKQAFDYKANQSGCVYVITSNFEKLRFYINDAVEYEEFNLYTLSEEGFSLLYLCIYKENLLSNLPLRIKNESIVEEEKITEEFYKDYSIFKRELYQNLIKNNSKNETFSNELKREDQGLTTKNIKLSLFKNSQKLIDRFLFIFFSEDRGLLSPNTTMGILSDWDKLVELDAHSPLYNRFKLFFSYLDQGRQGTEKVSEVFAYNGGLFKPDPIIDSLIIDDDLLYKHAQKLSKYDFNSQVDVNILGHIFENSLNEIENVNAEIIGIEFDKRKTKRKKDGVFYTPRYITKFMINKTVGKLCSLKKTELEISESEYKKSPKGRKKSTLKDLKDKLDQYRNWLLKITIVDPACGSGAFLNEALNYLIREHQYIDELETSLFGGGLVFRNIENTILEQNIYGVDINEESVEIAKLSLWLRTAQPRRKLNNLNQNIKCGNSLINSKSIAGRKAFDWKEAFPNVFERGGFDVVIGNPPYGDYFSDKEKEFITKKYSTSFSGTIDMYIFFYEVALNICSSGGRLCFITPNTFTDYHQFSGLRNLLIDSNNIDNVVGLTKAFEDAIVDTTILSLTKEEKQQQSFNGKIFKSKKNSLEDEELSCIASENLDGSGFIIKPSEDFDVKDFCSKQPNTLGDVVRITQGITTGGNDCFLGKSSIFLNTGISDVAIKKMVMGKTINRYRLILDDEYILYSVKTASPDIQKAIENHLTPYKEKLSKKRETKQGKLPWYCLHWARKEGDFTEPKILIRQTADNIIGVFDNSNYYPIDSLHTLNLRPSVADKTNNEDVLRFLLGILNSKLFKYLYKWKLDEDGKVYPQVKKVNIEWLPIPEIKNIQTITGYVVDIQNTNTDKERVASSFVKYIERTCKLKKVPSSILNWHENEFSDFIKSLNKEIKKSAGNKLSKAEEIEWMEVFDKKRQEVSKFNEEIALIDRKIDDAVYLLYGLDSNQIEVIESEIT
jgi:type I restriction-modification system DNA methylase subunit